MKMAPATQIISLYLFFHLLRMRGTRAQLIAELVRLGIPITEMNGEKP